MTALPEPQIAQHKIGTCPSCGCGVYADVELTVEVGAPWISTSGTASATTSVTKIGAVVEHACGSRLP